MALNGWLEYPLIDGSKFIDGTYAPDGTGDTPVVGYDGDLSQGVMRTSSTYGYSSSIVVSTTPDGRKILTPPDGSDYSHAGKIVYCSLYQRTIEAEDSDYVYRISFDIRLVNLAGTTLNNVSRGILGQLNSGGTGGSYALALVVNTTSGTATLGGVALPARIMSGDWVHVDYYCGYGLSSLVIDNDPSSETTVSFTGPTYPPNYSFLINGLNTDAWPSCPHIELGNPSVYILYKEEVAPFLTSGDIALSSSDTVAAVYRTALGYEPDSQATRETSGSTWIMIPDTGSPDFSNADSYTVTDAGTLADAVSVRVTAEDSTEVTYADTPVLIRDILPLEDFMSAAWSTGETSRTVRVTTSGTYTVTVTNPEGSATASVDISFPSSDTAYDAIFKGDPLPEGAWLFGQSNVYRTGLATVQSQYSASPRILALAALYWDKLNPAEEIQSLLDNMLNVATAKGYGLDVWGRIVGIKRATVPVSGEYLAFDPEPLDNPLGDSWNNAPFNPLTAQGLATDPVFRVYVMVKAMMNIGNGSLADLNKYFSLMFPNSGIKVIHAGTMIIRVLDYDAVLTDAAILALKSIDWVPAGVGWQVWQGAPDCFGFLGSELQPFDQAPFISDSALIFE